MGEVDRDIALPVSQPTMCAFPGEALDELYVTTASDKLSPEQRRREPLCALLRLRPGESGIVRPCMLLRSANSIRLGAVFLCRPLKQKCRVHASPT
jgi:SMP-30/Gluconolactonase/LRE-like region